MANYNHAHLIGGALQAILEQSAKPMEVLVVDDGSELDYLQEKRADFEDEIEELRSRIERLKRDLALFDEVTSQTLWQFDGETALKVSQYGQEIGVLTSNLDHLFRAVQEAQIAKAEQAGAIRVVESAVAPRFPAETGRGQFALGLGPVSVMGLFLGVVAAAAVSYVQNLLRRVPAAGGRAEG